MVVRYTLFGDVCNSSFIFIVTTHVDCLTIDAKPCHVEHSLVFVVIDMHYIWLGLGSISISLPSLQY